MSTATTGTDTDYRVWDGAGTQDVYEVDLGLGLPAIPTQRETEDTDLPLCSFNADPVPDMDDHVLACGDCFAYYRMEN